MRALVQRVTAGSVAIDGETVGKIGPGLVILLGVAPSDTAKDAAWLAAKCANLRIFEDDAGKMNRSLQEVGGAALIVSQFTLYGDCTQGRRPFFGSAAEPAVAIPLYETFIAEVKKLGVPVATGRFGAYMQLEIHNDGPVTLMVESK